VTEEDTPRDVPPPVAAPEDERAWWDISGIDIPGSDYQPVREVSDELGDADRDQVGLVSTLQTVAEPVADAIGSVLSAAGQVFSGESGGRHRRLRHQNATPLANLHVLHPEVRNASPRELGLRFVRIEEIAGTAVAGIDQRGGDFLPLEPFRGPNWRGRWQRISQAMDRLESLPPVDLVKFGGEYWVVDGHNRVAAVLYANGVGVDAAVTELEPRGGQVSERPTALLSLMGDSRALRAAGMGLQSATGAGQPGTTAHGRGAPDGASPDENAPSGSPGWAADEGERP
jgi:hypothetical protein